MTKSLSHGGASGTKPRVAALVGLALMEVIRARDLPTEVLAAEDPTQTMPRRLGLSEVVDGQIRRFREEVRRKRRMSDSEVGDLFRLVLRRPDSEDVFLQAGELLAGRDESRRGFKRILPEKARMALARRFVRRRVKALFGRSIGGFAHGAFTWEARNHFLLDMDPGGDACYLLRGFSQAVLSRFLGRQVEVTHSSCRGRKADHCRWAVETGQVESPETVAHGGSS